MTSAMFGLAGKRAVVTGGTRGIGFEIARGMAAAGARVLVCGRTHDAARRAADSLGPEADGHAVDVASEASVRALADYVAGPFGGIDILVNNAGIDPHYASLEDTSTEDWREIMGVNLDGVFWCCKYLASAMLQGRGGAVINVSSIAGRTGLKRQAPYSASKGGVEQLTKTLALDWAERGVRVNAVAYGFIKTDLTAGITAHPHIGPRLLARTPMGRFGEVHEVAGAAVFLASDAASYVTGHTLMVDGGWTAG